MKNLLVIALGLFVATSLTLNAADKGAGRKQLSPEAQELRKEMIKKYDANGDKRLDKDEIAKISTEDKEKMEKAGLRFGAGGKKKQ
ncbi:MAG: hypothetical protein HZA90_22700 [Verrucomicrobia bacterium]|nr:hypothetical protein [Verrucomicrobiota bacterium]